VTIAADMGARHAAAVDLARLRRVDARIDGPTECLRNSQGQFPDCRTSLRRTGLCEDRFREEPWPDKNHLTLPRQAFPSSSCQRREGRPGGKCSDEMAGTQSGPAHSPVGHHGQLGRRFKITGLSRTAVIRAPSRTRTVYVVDAAQILPPSGTGAEPAGSACTPPTTGTGGTPRIVAANIPMRSLSPYI